MNAIVCLPKYNEIDSIEEMISRIRDIGMDLFISDANSIDGTIEAAKEMGAEVYFHPPDNKGKGVGLKSAMEIALKKALM